MIDPLPPDRQEFLAVMGLADEFTAEMARFVTENPETDAIIQDLTCQNAFVTRLPDSQRYRFHHMMKECALRKFRTLPEQSQSATGTASAAGTARRGSICTRSAPTEDPATATPRSRSSKRTRAIFSRRFTRRSCSSA